MEAIPFVVVALVVLLPIVWFVAVHNRAVRLRQAVRRAGRTSTSS